MASVKREYHAPHRARQAQATRDSIAAAARRLFASGGYAATTIEAIAREAGVAIQTIYATFGSKRAIVLSLLDAMEEEGGVEQLQAELARAAGDPVRQIRHWVAFTRRFFERGTDLLEMARAAEPTEPDVAAHVREGERRRRAGAAAVVRSWAAAGVLRPRLEEQKAQDLAWTMLSPEVFRLLVVESGWSGEEYERWLSAELIGLLLAPSAAGEAVRSPEGVAETAADMRGGGDPERAGSPPA